MKSVQNKFELNPKVFFKASAAVIAFLIIMGIVSSLITVFTPYKTALGIVPLFNLDAEGTLAVYFSSLNLGVSSFVLWLIAMDRKTSSDKFWRHWLGLSFGFLILAIDESASIHELLVLIPKDHLNISAPIHYGIAALGIIVIASISTIYFRFLIYLPAQSRKLFILSGALFVLWAFVAESIGGYLSSHQGELGGGFYHVEIIIEESLEMVGILLFVRALFLHIENNLTYANTMFRTISPKVEREATVLFKGKEECRKVA